MDPLIHFLRRNSWARHGLSVLSIALLITAVGLLGYPFYTNLQQNRLQDEKTRQLASPELQDAYRNGTLKDGDALTRIQIPAIDVDVVVVEGISATALRAGAGHYPSTPLPCEAGNVGIAGHRTTYGKPFANLDRLKPKDVIVLETPVGKCTYTVSQVPYVVGPREFSVVANDPSKRTLTLTTCHPKGSAAKRLIVKATLTKGEDAAA